MHKSQSQQNLHIMLSHSHDDHHRQSVLTTNVHNFQLSMCFVSHRLMMAIQSLLCVVVAALPATAFHHHHHVTHLIGLANLKEIQAIGIPLGDDGSKVLSFGTFCCRVQRSSINGRSGGSGGGGRTGATSGDGVAAAGHDHAAAVVSG